MIFNDRFIANSLQSAECARYRILPTDKQFMKTWWLTIEPPSKYWLLKLNCIRYTII